MQVGDPKKTAILAIVAVGALGFCFKQLTGGGSEPKVLRKAEGTAAAPDAGGAQPQAVGTVAMLQLDELRVDAFSHAKLAPKIPGNPLAGQGTPTDPLAGGGTGVDPAPNSGGGGGKVPWLPNGVKIDKTNPGPDWPTPINPGQKPPETQVVKLTQVTLKAIVKVNQRLAYISIDGQEARSFRPGDLIKNDIQVAFVNDDSVIVKSSTKTVTLKVGQQGDL